MKKALAGIFSLALAAAGMQAHAAPAPAAVPQIGELVQAVFYANGGTPVAQGRFIDKGTEIGKLPTTKRIKEDAWFLGWFTAEKGGTKITAQTKLDEDATYYAHWDKGVTMVSDKAGVNVTASNPTDYTSKVITSTLTGADTHQLQYSRSDNPANSSMAYTLKIDGQVVWSDDKSQYDDVEVSIVKTSKNEKLVNIVTTGTNGILQGDKLYRYADGKLVQAVNLLKATPGAQNRYIGKTIGTSNGTVVKYLVFQNSAVGLYEANVTFKISGSKATLAKKAVNISMLTTKNGVTVHSGNHVTATKKLQTYTTAGGTKKSYTLTKGQSFWIGNMKVVKGKVYFLTSIVKKSKEYRGWIKAGSTKLIKEAHYAN
ncbi:MAG: InlB B-repeat-containing protein [Propionibacteriaceae bacterium]|jgi:hypothetical protein|nr:InlB B-repeat-containing protein [Propionibacteriaceae bacterium]